VISTYVSRLEQLAKEGRLLQARLSADSVDSHTPQLSRLWQKECAAIVNTLSGGAKSHWLSRAFSQAFLVRSTGEKVVENAPAAEIVGRIVEVLNEASASLASLDGNGGSSKLQGAPPARRFDFVHDAALRPVLEAAYLDSRNALEERRFEAALTGACGLLEAIVTDALVHSDQTRLKAGMPEGRITDYSFEARIACAERAGLIRGGCARLPPVAWRYRELIDADGRLRADASVSERDARLASQVLQVVLRDLDPGR
jgi:hypothetical protein